MQGRGLISLVAKPDVSKFYSFLLFFWATNSLGSHEMSVRSLVYEQAPNVPINTQEPALPLPQSAFLCPVVLVWLLRGPPKGQMRTTACHRWPRGDSRSQWWWALAYLVDQECLH